MAKKNSVNKKGAIIVIEDDQDDQDIFSEVFRELNRKNEIIFFSGGQEALDHLRGTYDEPFIVFSGTNMPKLSGIELRKQVFENESIRLKTIPYLFFTASAEQCDANDAYSKSIQRFFAKPSEFGELQYTIRVTAECCRKCASPNFVECPKNFQITSGSMQW
ncbi:response regulator [Flavobacterium sp. HJSW_4]|uniref:response regulator n=1 Tax=Flavobacterium sp. HJSW_4 TaxID=3344660 RepID=UPI0035F2759E